jgi:hypothetical protein
VKVLVAILLFSVGATAQMKNNEFSKNVNSYDPKSSYTGDYDTSKFRLGILSSSYSSKDSSSTRVPSSFGNIEDKLRTTPSQLCQAVKNIQGLDLKDSSAYVVSALKKAGTIPSDDKTYSLNSAHYFWELYLSYRDLVDITQPLNKSGEFKFSKLPDATIVMLEKGCNANGIAAIHCGGRYYAPKFVDTIKLEARLNNPQDKSCKLGKGFRVVAEAKRFL